MAQNPVNAHGFGDDCFAYTAVCQPHRPGVLGRGAPGTRKIAWIAVYQGAGNCLRQPTPEKTPIGIGVSFLALFLRFLWTKTDLLQLPSPLLLNQL